MKKLLTTVLLGLSLTVAGLAQSSLQKTVDEVRMRDAELKKSGGDLQKALDSRNYRSVVDLLAKYYEAATRRDRAVYQMILADDNGASETLRKDRSALVSAKQPAEEKKTIASAREFLRTTSPQSPILPKPKP